MATRVLLGRTAILLEVEGYTASSETARASLADSVGDYSAVDLVATAVSIQGGVGTDGAAVTVRLYDQEADGVCLAEFDVTLDANARGGVAVAAVAGDVLGREPMWWTLASDTSGDYSVRLQVEPAARSVL